VEELMLISTLLGVHLDEHLNWKCLIGNVSSISVKLRRANGALSKLCHFIPTRLLVNIYHAIFMSQRMPNLGPM